MWHLIAPAIVGALSASVGALVGRAVIALGIGFVTYNGLGYALDSLRAQVVGNMNSIPIDAASLLGFLWFDRAIMMIMSAYAAALSIRLVGGSIKKMVFK